MGAGLGRVVKVGLGGAFVGQTTAEECTADACARMSVKDPKNVYRWEEGYQFQNVFTVRRKCIRNKDEVYCREGLDEL